MSHTPRTPASIDDGDGSGPGGAAAPIRFPRPDVVHTIGMGFFPDELGLSGPVSAWLPGGHRGEGR